MARFLPLMTALALLGALVAAPLLSQGALAAEARQQPADKSMNPNAMKPKLQDTPADTLASLTQDCDDARSVCEKKCNGKSAAQSKNDICAQPCGPLDVLCSAAKAKLCNKALEGAVMGAINKAFGGVDVCVPLCIEKKTDACEKVDAAYKEMVKTIKQSGFKPK